MELKENKCKYFNAGDYIPDDYVILETYYRNGDVIQITAKRKENLRYVDLGNLNKYTIAQLKDISKSNYIRVRKKDIIYDILKNQSGLIQRENRFYTINEILN